MEILIYDTQMQFCGMVKQYMSFIWAERSRDVGDSEIYAPATQENFDLLKINRIVKRSDLNSLHIIKRIEISTDVEQGDYIIAKAYDIKGEMDNRTIEPEWRDGQTSVTINGDYWNAIRPIISETMINPLYTERGYKIGVSDFFSVADEFVTGKTIDDVVSLATLGERLRIWSKNFNMGYRVLWDGTHAVIDVFEGTERNVIFTEEFGNLISTKYILDTTDEKTETLLGAKMSSNDIVINCQAGYNGTMDSVSGFIRKELPISIDTPSSLTFAQLKAMFSNYEIVQVDNKYMMRVRYLVFEVQSSMIADWLDIHANDYCVMWNINEYHFFVGQYVYVADVGKASPNDNDACNLTTIGIMSQMTLNRRIKPIEYFVAEIVPDARYKFREDYDLEDIITIRNRLGITVQGVVIESLESWDENGYNLEIKYELI